MRMVVGWGRWRQRGLGPVFFLLGSAPVRRSDAVVGTEMGLDTPVTAFVQYDDLDDLLALNERVGPLVVV